MTLSYSMAAFALAASITPGPVNVVALGAGARYGLVPSLRHVTGATVAFVLLLVAVGFGLYELLQRAPVLMHAIQWFGVAFLLYMAYKLARDDGEIGDAAVQRGPSVVHGAIMQWLNPKAWLAAFAGMGLYTAGEPVRIWQFAAIYFVVCWLSVGCWAAAGAMMRRQMRSAKRVRRLNRVMAALLAASAVYLAATL
ncbi:LysE family translocator [Pandoraea nosoerga]|uniref:Lysine transporter LysE n=1 Tax=Pandoraea nosoerga TaxID=2508296 RepID=A0A5E4RVU5_9BURK|nr:MULTISPECIES: LysE family translocator [Pandoraea]MBN4664658.1 LysE family translocator [Pandoraea nosoerga]MBN4674307.1 LysE family translocator [Pandoraea nosoerga]MBN4679576.1 LysE family translocator [Pandoraea nosoerga]MBN4743335.1 LysE family translocator [Pandoraea nosoerga]VVD66951.1 lysine transporter LysE [Pandoraea nosoerga]